MSCAFSDAIRGTKIVVSPSGEWLLSYFGSRLSIIDAHSLEIFRVCSCVDKIEQCVFSPDSAYILCALFARNAVQVFSVFDMDWNCRINEGS